MSEEKSILDFDLLELKNNLAGNLKHFEDNPPVGVVNAEDLVRVIAYLYKISEELEKISKK